MQYLSDDFAIGPQITAEELSELKAQGIASVFCHRPDDEVAGQPSFEDLKAHALSVGLKMYHLPVSPGNVTDADVDAFRALYQTAPKPILGYCKGGGRAKVLWEFSQS